MDETKTDSALATARILRDSKSIIENDHFVYVSGDHGSGWIDKDVIYPHTELINELAKLLAERVKDLKPEIICGPATGGLILSQWLAHHLKVQSIFAEHRAIDAGETAKENDAETDGETVGKTNSSELLGRFVLRRHYDKLVKNKRVLIVDDIVNTGYSIRQTIDAVRTNGGEVLAAAAICTRGNASSKEAIGTEDFRYLLEYKIPSWSSEHCKLCETGVPVNTAYAHGLEYLQRQKKEAK